MNRKKPTGIYTYLLNDLAEEFKAKPILLSVFSEEETEENSPKKETEEKEETGEKSEKQGFFKKLFRKK